MRYSRATIYRIATLLIAALILGATAQSSSGFDPDPEGPKQPEEDTHVYLPLVTQSLPPIIPDTTEVLTDETTEHLSSVSEDGSMFTFSQSTPELEEVAPGDVMVSGVTDVAPDGFLREVTGVTKVGDEVYIDTESATLDEAVQQGQINLSRALSPADVENSTLLPGVSLRTNATQPQSAFSFNLKDVVLYDVDGNHDTTNDQVTANGGITFESTYDFSLSVEDWQLENLEFIYHSDETAELTIDSNVEYPVAQFEREIARHYFAPITVAIGPLPVVFTPVLKVIVGVDGSVHAGVTTGVTQQAVLDSGLRYANNSWEPVSNFNNGFEYLTPTLSAGLDLKGYAGAQLSLMLYGVVGPHVELNAYLKLEADVNAVPWWQLYGGLEMPAGVKIEVLSHVVAGYEATVIDYRIPLAQANSPPDLPADPVPADGATDQSVNANLAWTGGDPDGDVVTYDVYFEANDSTPDLLVCDDAATNSCDPGTLDYDTQYYWQIIAQDEDGETATGSVWSFTTGTSPNNPPSAPSSPTPSNGATDQSVGVNLGWTGGDPDGDSVSYDVYFEAGDTEPDVLLCDDIESMTCDPGTLNNDTHYYWHVVAEDEHGATTSGPVWDFTTGTAPNNAPNVPSNPSPADGAVSIPVTDILSWTGGDPDNDSVTYDVYLEADNPTPDILVSDDQSDTSFDPGTLNYDAQYYWQIVAEDERGAVTEGPIWNFTTGTEPNNAPETPSDPTPQDGATGQDVNVDLGWSGGDPDGDNVIYDIYFESGDSTPDVLLCDDVSATACDPGTLSYDTHYYWQVIAQDEHGATTTGPVWDFTTGTTPNGAPDSPSNPSPADGAVGVPVTDTLNWTGGDPDGDSLAYDVYFEAGDSTPDVLLCEGVSSPSCDPGTLDNGTIYYWQVIATDEYGSSTAGPVWVFETTVEQSAVWQESFTYADGTVPASIVYYAVGGSVHDLEVLSGKLQATIDTTSYGDYARIHWRPDDFTFARYDPVTIEFEGYEKTGYNAGNNYGGFEITASSLPLEDANEGPGIHFLTQNRYHTNVKCLDEAGTLTTIESDMYSVSDGTHFYRLELNHVSGTYQAGSLRFYRDGTLVASYDSADDCLASDNRVRFRFIGDDPYGAIYTWDDVALSVAQ